MNCEGALMAKIFFAEAPTLTTSGPIFICKTEPLGHLLGRADAQIGHVAATKRHRLIYVDDIFDEVGAIPESGCENENGSATN